MTYIDERPSKYTTAAIRNIINGRTVALSAVDRATVSTLVDVLVSRIEIAESHNELLFKELTKATK